ncbi:MAG: thermosome subunit alpha [Halobacteriaceae archaeon]
MSQGQRGRGGPIFILGEDAQRTQGRDAQNSNISAGKAVAESVRTTLGPKGMDKMLVDDTGEVVITNDGVTILDEMDIEHPAAQMLVEVAQSQENEVGDGTTSASVLAGQLLAEAEDLLEQDVHPTTVVEGYAAARDVALEAVEDLVLEDELSEDVLRAVARSSMTGKGTGDVDAETLATLVVDAIEAVTDEHGDVHREDVLVHTQKGASSSATDLVEGVLVDAEPLRSDMPREVEDATVAVLSIAIENREADVDASYEVDSVDQLNAAIEAEENELRGYVDALAEAGVDVVFTKEEIDERIAGTLADAGILAFDDIDDLGDEDSMKAVARATGATPIGTLSEVDPDDLGVAERISVKTFGKSGAEDTLTFVEGGADTQTVTLFVRGGTDHVTDELERATGDALDVVSTTLRAGGVVPGAGASEVYVANRVRDEAAGIPGRKQLAAEAFADALDAIPRTLAANTGMDPIDALVDLRAASTENAGRAGIIISGETGEIADPVEHGVLDPAAVKTEALENATEAATMITRIDDVIEAGD